MRNVRVELGSRSYEVLIGAGLLDSLGDQLQKLQAGRRCAVISDSNVAPLYAEQVLHSLRSVGFEPLLLTVPAGERSKSMPQVTEICEKLATSGFDRSSWIVALGGGVIGDLAGFAASIYYRGIPFVQIPTSVVAQVDSSVGGKTGVNAKAGKNLIGSFHQPKLVVADVQTLESLPEREFLEGFAEIIKHAIIRNEALFAQLGDFDKTQLVDLIARNVEIKAGIVSADETETKGQRALLNFGHTIGHGIENAAGYGRYLHGEAISLGIVAAARLSVKKAGLSQEACDQILLRLKQFKLPQKLPPDISTETILSALETDKKFVNGQIRFVLCPKIGDAMVSKEVTRQEIIDAIEDLR
jgi:3-dehydroquinate synthase